jgi:hypothetical protein
MHATGPVEHQIVDLSCAQLARFRAWFATHQRQALSDPRAGADAAERLETLTRDALAVARQIPATGGACGLPRGPRHGA